MKIIRLTPSQERLRTEGRVGNAFKETPDETADRIYRASKKLRHGGTKQFRNRVATTRAANKVAKQSRKVNR